MMNRGTSNIILYIKSIYNSLTKSEQKVAEAILKDNERIIYSSITDFAEISEVGDATVLRFCRKIGFKSYQSFKLELAKELSNQNNPAISTLNDEFNANDSLGEIARKTINLNISAINETLTLIDLNEIQKAVELMISAQKIYFFGSGVSQITAQDAVYKFTRIGLNVATYVDYHMQLMQASLLTNNDVGIGISFSGSTKDTLEVLRNAKQAGAQLISITHHAKSPITKIADIVLLHGSKEDPLQGGAFPTKISQLIVIDILYNAIYKRIEKEAIKYKELTSKAILDRLL
ncbi:MAG TPA: transcriptional regulator [Firmicutes bacterium]|jgi:DNA-binding MurR/RpiR family transcriptional regulator|nr:transcriptional regulator [Bacillota bacterium]